MLEVSWPHMQLVYEILLRFVLSKEVDSRTAKEYFSKKFMVKLLNLFDSEDPRERDYLKVRALLIRPLEGRASRGRPLTDTAMHPHRRSCIASTANPWRCGRSSVARSATCSTRSSTRPSRSRASVSCSRSSAGILPVIQFACLVSVPSLTSQCVGSIINGFALPLKLEHQRFLERALLPLHTVSARGSVRAVIKALTCVMALLLAGVGFQAGNLAMFHQQLAYCTTQFVEKDPQTAETIILALLKFWPVTASSKEVSCEASYWYGVFMRAEANWTRCDGQILFLNELEELIELVQMEQFATVLRPLFLRLAQSVCSSHFQVSQRALYLWNNESLVRLVSARRAEVLPLIFGALYRNCENHWHRFVAIALLGGDAMRGRALMGCRVATQHGANANVQRAEAVHGNGLAAVRPVLGAVRGARGEVSGSPACLDSIWRGVD